MTDPPGFAEWASRVAPEITADTLWRMAAYRYSLYLMACSQNDVRLLIRRRETRSLIDQLLRAVGSISANLEEAYSRSSSRERAHFYEYALGSGRESKGWYHRCAVALPQAVTADRIALVTRIIRILTAVVPRERAEPSRWRARREDLLAVSDVDHAAATSASKRQPANG